MGKPVTDRQVLRLMVEILTEAEIREVLDYISIMQSLQEQLTQSDLFHDNPLKTLTDLPAQGAVIDITPSLRRSRSEVFNSGSWACYGSENKVEGGARNGKS